LKKQNSRNTGKVIIVILIVIKHWYWNLGHRICLISPLRKTPRNSSNSCVDVNIELVPCYFYLQWKANWNR
jgi:hypothetical protein